MDRMKLFFLAGVQVGEDIYFSAWNTNGLFKMNPGTNECVFLTRFEGEAHQNLHSAAVCYEGALWFIPSNSDRIARVDIQTLAVTYLSLPEYGADRTLNGVRQFIRFKHCYDKGERYLWLTPYAYNFLIRVDLEERKLTAGTEYPVTRFSDSIRIGEEIWLCPRNGEKGLIVNVVSGEAKEFSFGEGKPSYLSINRYKDWVLFCPYDLNDGIVMQNRRTNERKYVHYNGTKSKYYTMCVSGSQAFFAPFEGDECILVDLEKETCTVAERLQKELLPPGEKNGCYLTCMKYEDTWWFLPCMPGIPVLCWNPASEKITYRYIETARAPYEEVMMEIIKSRRKEEYAVYGREVAFENELSLELLAELLKGENREEHTELKAASGRQIYETVKGKQKT